MKYFLRLEALWFSVFFKVSEQRNRKFTESTKFEELVSMNQFQF